MAGDTSQVCISTLRVQWDSHSSYAAICTHWTITKDQLVRLRNVLPLPKRLDRRMRYRPTAWEEPTPEEVAASEASLDLAPQVAAQATCVSVEWTEEIRRQRQVQKPTAFTLTPLDTDEVVRGMVDDHDRGNRFQ